MSDYHISVVNCFKWIPPLVHKHVFVCGSSIKFLYPFYLSVSPFDKDDQASAASTVNKPPTVNKRFSTYNQSPPDTPSLREQAFYVSTLNL